MIYPEYAEIKGKKYKLKTDYRVALQCFEVVEDDTIGDVERSLTVIFLLFGFIPDEDLDLFLEKASIFLQCGQKAEQPIAGERDMDFIEDKSYIMASFMSDYQIDLSTEKMHFWRYIDLIRGLTEHSALSKVRELRNYDVSDIKDAKTRNKILRAKEAVALKTKLTAEEQNAIDEFEAQFE